MLLTAEFDTLCMGELDSRKRLRTTELENPQGPLFSTQGPFFYDSTGVSQDIWNVINTNGKCPGFGTFLQAAMGLLESPLSCRKPFGYKLGTGGKKKKLSITGDLPMLPQNSGQ